MKKEKQQTAEKQTLRMVFRECAYAMRLSVMLYTVSAVLTGAIGVVTANILSKFTDAAFSLNLSLGLQNTVIMVICIFALVFVVPLFGMLSDFCMLKNALRHDMVVFAHYLDTNPEKAMSLNSGETQYQLEDAPNTLRIYWVTLLSKAISLPFCLGYLLYCAGKTSWLLTAFMLLLTALKLLSPLFFKEKLAKYEMSEKNFYAKRRDYESDIMENLHIIRLWRIQKPMRDRIDGLFQNFYRETETHHISCRVFAEQTQGFLNQFTLILLLMIGAVMIANGNVTPGEFAAMFIYFTIAQTLFSDIGDIIQNYPIMINAGKRVCKFYSDTETNAGEPITHFSYIQGKDIRFAYTDKAVFENLNFSITRGEKIAIVGENGKGKSTFIKIICLMLKNYQGFVQVDGIDLQAIRVEDWRRIIAYAPQTAYLFRTTVRENITMGNSLVNKEIVDKFMSDFGILPLADRTISMNSELSGGEKQKISIIRAFLKDADILILDEPSNHLDQTSCTALKQYIAATDKTVLLVTHDDSLLDAVKQQIVI